MNIHLTHLKRAVNFRWKLFISIKTQLHKNMELQYSVAEILRNNNFLVGWGIKCPSYDNPHVTAPHVTAPNVKIVLSVSVGDL